MVGFIPGKIGRGYSLVRELTDVFSESEDHQVGFAAINNNRE